MFSKKLNKSYTYPKKMRPGHCTKKIHPGSPEVTFLGTGTSFAQSHPTLLKKNLIEGNFHPNQSQFARANTAHGAKFIWLKKINKTRMLRRAYSRSVWIIFFEFVKVCGIRFSIWESFIGFYICCYPISTILACLFSVGVRISWKKLC